MNIHYMILIGYVVSFNNEEVTKKKMSIVLDSVKIDTFINNNRKRCSNIDLNIYIPLYCKFKTFTTHPLLSIEIYRWFQQIFIISYITQICVIFLKEILRFEVLTLFLLRVFQIISM